MYINVYDGSGGDGSDIYAYIQINILKEQGSVEKKHNASVYMRIKKIFIYTKSIMRKTNLC